ncbi:MAG: ABC transporter ATP-binding protein [Blastocatellia bacterium]|nr:ABC transporter ATP-binding protein [Blastocatellia bacterium]
MDVRFENVTKMFARSAAVACLNLAIDRGEFVVLLGPSGCGKTTTLRMLAGLEDATSGDIFIGPERVNLVPTRYRDIAMVFQSYALYPHMTVAQNIAYPLRVRKTRGDEIERRVKRVADMLEIEGLLARKPRELSGGERQRVALARAIIREPRVYLMDEPLSNLDAKLRVQMRGELKRLQHDLGTTTLYVTHDQAEAMTLAHRVAVMRGGRLQQFDTPMEIYNRPANRFVAEFVGSPGMNFIEGRIDAGARMFAGDGIAIPLEGNGLDRVHGRERVTLGIRPEQVHVATSEREGWLAGKVYVTELMGNETIVFLRLGNEKIIARAGADFRAEMEKPVWIWLRMEKADFFDAETGEAIR